MSAANEIDTLFEEVMDKDPLLCTPSDIDAIIARHRATRARQAEGGPRPKRGTEGGPKPTLDLAKLGLIAAKEPAETIKRRL